MKKYSSKRTELMGLTFDSKAEAKRYGELLLAQKAGLISGLVCQVPFELAPKVKLLGDSRSRPALRIVVDFCYCEKGQIVFEDTKGFDTPLGRAKRHLLKHTHNIDVRITK